jgi:hypothetical protein
LAFSSILDSHFLGVAEDSSIVFCSTFGLPQANLSLIHSKEVSQAFLSEAIVKTKEKVVPSAVAMAQEGTSAVQPGATSMSQNAECSVAAEDEIPIATSPSDEG